MRTLLLSILLAGVASAQDVLVAGGKSLADFRVEFRVSEIDRSSPMAFAQSWAALHAEEQVVARRFHDRFEQAHLAILDRFYDAELIALQRKLYKQEVRDVNDLTCKVLEEKAGPRGRQLVYVRRRWIDAIDRPREDRAQLMFRKEKDGKWRLVEVRYEIRPGVIATDMTAAVKEKYDKLIDEGLTPIKHFIGLIFKNNTTGNKESS